MLHSKTKGTIGELAVAKFLAESGLPVFVELGDTSKVDLITIVNDKPITIQVKSFKTNDGIINFSFKKSGPNYRFNYKSSDFDYLALHAPDKDEILWLPSTMIDTQINYTFRFDLPKAGQPIKIIILNTLIVHS